ncbi:hypothetical protein EI94DRAFT_1610499, partial [Lactarius quietus]
NKLASLPIPAPASYVAGPSSEFFACVAIGSYIPNFKSYICSEVEAKRSDEPDVDHERLQDPDNEYD